MSAGTEPVAQRPSAVMSGGRSRAVIVAIATAYGAICSALLPPGPFTTPDSAAYLQMQPIVPLAYPAFLAVVGGAAAGLVQAIAFAAALACFGLELLALSRSVALTAVALAGIMTLPGLRDLHASILTESLFMSGLVAFLAALAAFAREPSLSRAVLAGVIAGTTATVRRTGYAFLPVLAFAVLSQSRDRRAAGRALAANLLAAAAILAVEHIGAVVVHGEQRTSLAGRHLFAKAALIDADVSLGLSDDPQHARLEHALRDTVAPVRALLREAPDQIRPSLTLYYETCLQWPCLDALGNELGPIGDAAHNDLLAEVAIQRIRAAPGEFVRLTLRNYGSLWTAYKLEHPATAAALADFLNTRRPLPLEREVFKVAPSEAFAFTPRPVVRIVQPAVLAIGWFTGAMAIVGMVAALRGTAGPLLLVATMASLTAHGCLLFSAVAAAGISRFTIAVLPAVVIAVVTGVWHGVRAVAGRVARA